MAYLKLRRLIELLVLDHPALSRVFRAREDGSRAAPAQQWDGFYERGVYDTLLHSDRRHHHRLLAALIAERFPHGRVLEVGCGQGAFYESLRPFAPARYLGTDISGRAIAQASARFAGDLAAGTIEFRTAEGAALEAAESFDAVIFADCIEYLGPVDQLVARYAGMLAPGGVIGVTQWLALHPLGIWREIQAHVDILDEALVAAPWGGAWQVWTGRPKQAAPDG